MPVNARAPPRKVAAQQYAAKEGVKAPKVEEEASSVSADLDDIHPYVLYFLMFVLFGRYEPHALLTYVQNLVHLRRNMTDELTSLFTSFAFHGITSLSLLLTHSPMTAPCLGLSRQCNLAQSFKQ